MAVIPFLSMLVASPQAEAVKRITLGLRVVHPGCRIEAVYSEEEALEWAIHNLEGQAAPRGPWQKS